MACHQSSISFSQSQRLWSVAIKKTQQIKGEMRGNKGSWRYQLSTMGRYQEISCTELADGFNRRCPYLCQKQSQKREPLYQNQFVSQFISYDITIISEPFFYIKNDRGMLGDMPISFGSTPLDISGHHSAAIAKLLGCMPRLCLTLIGWQRLVHHRKAKKSIGSFRLGFQ